MLVGMVELYKIHGNNKALFSRSKLVVFCWPPFSFPPSVALAQIETIKTPPHIGPGVQNWRKEEATRRYYQNTVDGGNPAPVDR